MQVFKCDMRAAAIVVWTLVSCQAQAAMLCLARA